MREQRYRQPHGKASQKTSFLRSRTFLVLVGFLAITVVLLWQEHQAHILGGGLILLLLACPLMHFFMHGGHGGHGGNSGHNDNEPNRNNEDQSSETKGDRS